MACKCGYENAAGAKFCRSCGSLLATDPIVPTTGSAGPSIVPPNFQRPASLKASRSISVGRVVLLCALALAISGGYWWLHRPLAPYSPNNSGLYPITVAGKSGFMDRSGRIIIATQFDGVYPFSEGLAAVKVGSRFGFINTNGTIVITPQFDDVRNFRYGRAAVKVCCGLWEKENQGDKYGFIDQKGKFIAPPNFRRVGWYFSDGLAYGINEAGNAGFIDRNGKTLFEGKVRGAVGFASGLAGASEDGVKWGYLDRKGNWSISPQYDGVGPFADGLAAVSVGGRIGYVDRSGSFAINPQFDSGAVFVDGRAAVFNDGKVGFIDRTGRLVIAQTYLAAQDFVEGLAGVKTEDGWGFIDSTGKVIIPTEFDLVSKFQGGLAWVRFLDKEAYVTPTGELVPDLFPGMTIKEAKARALTVSITVNAQHGTVQLEPGQGMLLRWTSRYAVSCSMGAPFNFPVLINGLESSAIPPGSPYYPESDGTTYVITCTNGSAHSSDSVMVLPWRETGGDEAQQVGGAPVLPSSTSAVLPEGTPAPTTPASTYLPNQVDEAASARGCSPPRYPPALKAAGITGTVSLRFVIGVNGEVERPAIEVTSSTNSAFDAAAIAAMMTCRFNSAKIKGVPVRQLVVQNVIFTIGS